MELQTGLQSRTFSFYNMVIAVIIDSIFILHLVSAREVLWAVNCGGDEHTDVNGVHYEADPLDTGFSSDFGKNLIIHRVVSQDQILYQTERYHTSTFGYDIPIKGDGEYVLVLKFSEVWFGAPNQKVFDVVLNGEHTIVNELDIFARVGRGVAHDEVVPFIVKGGKLHVNDETSQIDGQKMSIEFIKGDLDNPKVNAIYLMKGRVADVPKLPPLPDPNLADEDEDEVEEVPAERSKKPPRKPSGPKSKDPYASEDASTMLIPVFAAVGAFIPLVYCLCKLK